MAAHVGMEDRQWVEFGSILKALHSSHLPRELAARVPRESFVPKHGELVRKLAERMLLPEHETSYQRELALFWQDRRQEIDDILQRADTLGRLLQAKKPAFVLCHADIHPHNVLVDQQDRLFIVDWDEVIVAPKERDLMFVTGAGTEEGERQEARFFKGYGYSEIDRVALAYYRYEWVVQEIGEYGAAVFQRDDLDAATKRAAARSLRALFDAGDVVDAAYDSSSELPPDYFEY